MSYESPVTPPTVTDYDVKSRSATVLKRLAVPRYDASAYEVTRLRAPARDQTSVPVTVLHARGTRPDGTHALYLTAYGSYGYPNDAGFSSNVLSLVDRGAVVAIAHIRGGGELGKAWHDAGRMMAKKNTFTDFVDVAEHLVATGWGAKGRIAIEGGSAGGLLMGAVTNMRPDLWKAVIAEVPFMDVMNTMLDPSLPLTVSEFEEWGDPRKEAEARYIASYSPYDNIAPEAYPAILVRTSYNDSQVMYWEPAKYVARLRATKTDANPLLLRTNMEPAGHGGRSNRYEALRDRAFDYAFLVTQLGLRP